MNFKFRFLSVALVNIALILGELVLFSQHSMAFDQRLSDLNLSDASDFRLFLVFLGGMVAGLVANILLLSSKRDEWTYDQIIAFVRSIRGK